MIDFEIFKINWINLTNYKCTLLKQGSVRQRSLCNNFQAIKTKKGSIRSRIEPKGQKLKIKELIDIKNKVFHKKSKEFKTYYYFAR